MEERGADSGQAKLVRQLKARLEDTEQERGSVVRQRRNLELELLDTQEQLEQSEQARRAAERECGAVAPVRPLQFVWAAAAQSARSSVRIYIETRYKVNC